MYGGLGDTVLLLLGMACSLGTVIAAALVAVTFFSAVARVLRRVEPDNRRMSPGQVWLNMVPVFNLVWAPVTVERVAESLRNEYRSRGMDGADETYGRPAGLTVLVLLAFSGMFEVLSVVVSDNDMLYVTALLYLIAFVSWVVYWVQLGRYARELKSGVFRAPPVDEGW